MTGPYKYIGNAIAYAQYSSRFRKTPWNPDSPDQISQAETRIGIKFPQALLEYCMSFGSNHHQIFGTQFFGFTLMSEMGEDWEEDSQEYYAEFSSILEAQFPECQGIPLLEFSNNDGYVNYCLVLNGEEDPICLVYIEGDKITNEGRFSKFLLRSLREFEKFDPPTSALLMREFPNIYR